MSRIKRVLVFSDVHIPFHNKLYLQLIKEAIKSINPDMVVINGDLCDMYYLSNYDKHPDVESSYDEEIQEAKAEIREIRESFTGKMVYILGNHEDRMDSYIIKNAGIFRNKLTIENELKLEDLDISIVKYKDEIRVYDTNLYITHSPPSYSVNASRSSLSVKYGKSYIYGCTHRPDWAYVKRSENGKFVYDDVTFCGFIGDKYSSETHKRVFRYEKNDRSAPAIVSVTVVDDVDHFCNVCMIKNDTLVVFGEVFKLEE